MVVEDDETALDVVQMVDEMISRRGTFTFTTKKNRKDKHLCRLLT